jgi:uncharacterized protein YceK
MEVCADRKRQSWLTLSSLGSYFPKSNYGIKEIVDVMIAKNIKWQARSARKLSVECAAQKMLILLCCAVPLSGCASALSQRTAAGSGQAGLVQYSAREWAGHGDGRVYGGVAMPTGSLSGILGSYRGCLVESRSRTLIVLTGAMAFHAPDGHSVKQHIFSKSLLGDQPASIIPVGGVFTVRGSKVKTLPGWMQLDQKIPAQCVRLRLFLTTTETLKPS